MVWYYVYMDTPLFFVFLAIHIVSLIVGMGAVVVIDTFGLLWIFKRIQLSDVMKVAAVTQRLIWAGWIGLVLSGIGLITLKGYIDNLTLIKLFFVALVGVNGIFMHVLKKSLESIQSNRLPARYAFRIALTSIISQIGWWSAIAIGFLHRHWKHVIDWPQNPYVYMASILVGIAAVALSGELMVRRTSRTP